jgi:adenine-specific DNA glycosylase
MIGSATDFARRLRAWYDRNRRDLPWRLPLAADEHVKLDPYKVLVSEAMLQQTQVATVIPYFQRFIAQFPNLNALANAQEQQVLRAWQGLGYYSRARNLQKAAKQILSEFSGALPETVEDLLKLPGIGRYTAARFHRSHLNGDRRFWMGMSPGFCAGSMACDLIPGTRPLARNSGPGPRKSFRKKESATSIQH